jgi:TonB family protein
MAQPEKWRTVRCRQTELVRLRAKSGCANQELARGPNPVSSAANIDSPTTEVAAQESRTTARPNPAPLEANVSVTGAKASGGNGSRDLFSEETTTVLVFKDGAVIRLAAPVSVGQLVFLTLKKTNQEVVCQVLGKKSGAGGLDYVELQFTEEQKEYWGVEFPESESEFKAAPSAPVKPKKPPKPTALVLQRGAEGDGDPLDAEVAALRKQLLGPEKKKTETAVSKAANVVPEKAPGFKEELGSVNAPAPVRAAEEEKPDLLMPRAKEKEEAPRAVIGMALPTEKKTEEERAPSEDLLPEPELDFSQVPTTAPNVDGGVKRFRGPVIGKKAREVGLSAMLVVALVAGAWHGKWWQYLPIGKKAATAVSAARPVTARSTAAGNTKAADPGKATAGSGGSATAAEENNSQTDQNGGSELKAEESATVKADASDASEASPNSRSVQEETAKKEDSAEAGAEAAAAAAESAASDTEVLPAKLLKAANPVYPPDAMRGYITGDVKAEVAVDASGHVGEVRVISGPAALRDAAVAALKQYQYAPATQGGKAMGSKAVEVVKFWFNP